MTLCSNCDYGRATRKGRCEACYRYWRRTGEERPLDRVWQAFLRSRGKRRGR